MRPVVPNLGQTLAVVFTVCLSVLAVMAEEECMNIDDENKIQDYVPCSNLDAQTVYCYECDSRIQPRCGDPFNYSRLSNEVVTQCQGCCVKIVRMKSTPYESVWRTCTRNIQINLFMVDHVCMYESNRVGHMCFCEEDHCNAAHCRSLSLLALGVVSILYVVWRRL